MTASGDGTRETGTMLDRIVADRRLRLAEDQAARPAAALEERAAAQKPPLDFAARLREGRPGAAAGAGLRLIAEIKRASPSKGVLHAGLDAAAQARAYADAGAAAVSVLTEPSFFQGRIEDLADAADALRSGAAGETGRPALLRKEFVFDRYQVIEARAHGADALLLIAMLLEPDALAELLALTRAQRMEALVEVHDGSEIEAAVAAGASVIGVNNRDLRSFNEDLGTFERLAPLVAELAGEGVTLVAESAITSAADAERMAAAGAHALLVGEALVRSGTWRGRRAS